MSECQDYTGYAKCTELQVINKLMDLLGCIPPWIGNLEDVSYCNQPLVYNDNSTILNIQKILKNFFNQARFMKLKVDLESGCKRPCEQMLIYVQQA